MLRFVGYRRCLVALCVVGILSLILPLVARADGDVFDLVPNTAVLLDHISATSSGGNGGNTSSTSSATNIFSPASYVDYKRTGGEPTTVVDRYPFKPGTFSCPATATTDCAPQDIVYVSNPLGVGYPGFSEFYKSMDGGLSFRVPPHDPIFAQPDGTSGGGGGDSHQAVGPVTHSVFFVDLSGACVTMNVSRDLGETFTSDRLGCGANPGAIDDRQWVATDETASEGKDVFVNFNNDSNPQGASLVLVKSNFDGAPGSFTASSCNAFSMNAAPSSDADPTACPDPSDPNLYIAGPVVVDPSHATHLLYIPFERNVGGNFVLYIAKSTDEGDTWTRQVVQNLGPHDAANIFPELTADTAGNLYYTWSQSQRFDTGGNTNTEGEADVFYTFSTDGGATWASPIDLTKETGDSAVFPWMVAGDPGQVDLVYYKANSGLNPNIAYYDSTGAPCDPSMATGSCQPNTTVWNTYFAQSNNALNTGANFKSVQISDHPIHQGGICTGGISCQSSAQQNRDLLDFFTVDIDHQGAAYVTWADDNNGRRDTRQHFSRQLAGNSVFKGQSIANQQFWPVTDHRVADAAGDVYDQNGSPVTCPSMDILATSEKASNDILTVSMTLGAPPTFSAAAACGHGGATGGLWGAEFWASSTPDPTQSGGNNDNFYIAYRDNPPDSVAPGVEAGRMNALSATLTSEEFHRVEPGTLGGNCFTIPAPVGACTITMTASLSGLGIKPGAGLYSITGLSVYYFGSESQPPFFRIPLGDSQQGDVAAPFDDNGTGTVTGP